MRKSQFWEGVQKTSIFEIPFFSILVDFRRSGGSKSLVTLAPFSLLPILGATFFARASFLPILMDFCVLGHICCDFLPLFFANAVAFSEATFCHESPRFWQKPPRFWSTFFTHTSATSLVECGGPRVSDLNRNARFLLRKIFAMIFETSLQTPPFPAECGGLRSLTRGPPHSTKLLGAGICEES